jgi:hypothetical protein
MSENKIFEKNLNDALKWKLPLKNTHNLSVTMRCIVTNSYDVRIRHSDVIIVRMEHFGSSIVMSFVHCPS